MADQLAHRGPDDGGVYGVPGVAALAHRRLSILDPSEAGRQPMKRAGQVLIYNGEIYNHHALRHGLEASFSSTSDTETLLQLLLTRGRGALDDLLGMFAFALWHESERKLLLVRDRLGIKPLHYREFPDGSLAFASEIGPLAQLEPAPTPCQQALRDFLTYKYVPTPNTVYSCIKKLPPGCVLLWQDGRVVIERWWQAESSEERNEEAAAAREFEALHEQTVREHMLSDVPVGVFLSGGLDSSAVAAALSPNATDSPEGLRTFTLGFDVASHDESAAAREIAAHLGTAHREQISSDIDLDHALDQTVRMYHEPFGDHGAWPTHLVASLASEDVKVALSGEGGDELFAGYQWYDKALRFRSNPWNRLLARVAPPLTAMARSAERRAASSLERYSMFLGPFTVRQKRALLDPGFWQHTGGEDYDDLWYFREHWREDLQGMKRLQWCDLHTYLNDDMLTKLDRASMAVSLEARPPFVDHRVVSFALSLAPALLRDSRGGKILTRRYLAPRMPAGVLDRRKIGFSMPVRRWVARRPERLRSAISRLHEAKILKSPRSLSGAGVSFTNEQTWCLLVLDRFLSGHQQR